MPELSIIVPVYNTLTDALQRCFDSVKALQDISYEVIVVDDGSKEPTASFCREYAEKEPGFVCLRKENGGVSSARNYGLDHATGRYVVFLDADDVLLPAAFAGKMMEAEPDLVILDTMLVEGNKESVWSAFVREAGEVSLQELLCQLIASKSLNGPYAKLFKRQIIEQQHIRFNTDFVTGEDWDFVTSFVLQVRFAIYYEAPCYVYYRDGGNSKARIARFPDVVLSNLSAMFRRKQDMLGQYFEKNSQTEYLASVAAEFLIEDMFNSAADLLLLGKLTRERKNIIRQACRLSAPYLLPNSSRKTRIKAWIAQYFWVGVYPLAYLRELYLKRKG